MDINLLLSILLPIIFVILILDFDEAMMLFSIGFISLAIAFNFSIIFSITSTSYNGFGLILNYVHWFIPVFAFTKTYFTAASSGTFDNFYGKTKKGS